MRVKVLETFDGIVEGKRFNKGKSYELTDERAEYLACKGYVEFEGEQSPSKPRRKAARNEQPNA